jgi:MFS family permease
VTRVSTTTEVGRLAVTLFALGIGEELWQAYLPAYLVALGASAAVVGAFASSKDLLDSLYQLPGGWLSDRIGARAAIRAFTLAAAAGYAAYASAWAWPVAFVGLVGAMAWKAGAFPATFALIGESLPPGRRVGAFTIQSLAVRVPRVVAAPLGGVLIAALGLTAGVRTGATIAVALAFAALALQARASGDRARAVPPPQQRALAVSLQPALRRLLGADGLVRVGESVAASFILLYVTGVRHVPLPMFGVLYAVQQGVSLALYLPAARLAAIVGSRPLVAATFFFFALFPLAVLRAEGPATLLLAFVAGGFKEIGEPARKAQIVDLCRPATRAREVALYYTIRNLLVVPGGLAGGLLWQRSPALVLDVAAAISFAGMLLFVLTSRSVDVPGPGRVSAQPAV